ncbi:helix-turn-helix transcriptional regulator [Rhizobium sp. XQZ8]|uniref:winged helix-turn-helix transcriptional regulator n=1 Tax=Rhizobium populisoli TaxID=2859785 RepID=UPI001C66AF7A|nr:helix-turn-helix transcriptional regulator [Rhizobium populisoli]
MAWFPNETRLQLIFTCPQGGTLQQPGNPPETANCVLIGRMLSRVTDKWTVLIVRVLGRGPCRFNALRRQVGEISQKVLASSLRDLEENGFVSRTVTPVNPPQVEYALTELGEEFLRPVRALAEWVLENHSRIDEARAKFAERRSEAD